MIHIFPVLRIDTNIGHIYGHIDACHNGHYGLFVENGHYGISQYGHRYGQYWRLCEEQEKCGSPVKAELKNMHRLKSYGQNKIYCQKVAKNERFTLYFDPKIKMGGHQLRMVGKL